MVYLQLPSQLTEEEQTLQRKYQKLKRKRKLLQQHKTPKPEPVVAAPIIKAKTESGATDAKEVAKKLLKSGKIHAIKAPENRQKERQDSGFKRSKAHERKRCTGTDKPGGYLPFHNQHSMEDDPSGSADLDDSLNNSGSGNDPANSTSSNKQRKPFYESFVHSRDPHSLAREETYREKKRDGKANYVNRDNPQQGNTIYVRGENMTEAFLRMGFSSFGTVLHIAAEPSKNCGFVTYDSIDTANMAINEMNDTALHGIRLKVSLARRQSVYNPEKTKAGEQATTNSSSGGGNANNNGVAMVETPPLQSLSTPEAWSAMASSQSDSAEKPKNRTVISYDEDDIYDTI
ncbi:Serine/threonine-protein kinase N2 [Tyrophagus putrescentiae]|nr:Serine/threonine-protein kinase N2 [Tyrophagus putrescentiae]